MPHRERISIEPDDPAGHVPFKREDLGGQEVTIRLEDGTEVQGRAFRAKYEHSKGDYTERLGGRYNRIEVEVDDTQANLLKAASDRGEPIHVRFPDGAEVTGHRLRVGEDATGEEIEGHGKKMHEDTTGDGTEGHGIVSSPPSNIF
jgi:hypothetical protein